MTSKQKKGMSIFHAHAWRILRHGFIYSALAIIICSGCSDDNISPPVREEPEPKPVHMKLNEKDSLAMVKMYRTMGPWVRGGWDLKEVTTWRGVSTAFDLDTDELRIVEFNVIGGTFKNYIPDEIGDLSELRVLCMSGGNIGGRIPETIGKLKHLTELSISENNISGEIPACIGNLKELRHLRITETKNSGKLPESIGYLNNLEYLNISQTDISGEIPKSFANIKNCAVWLTDNKLSGTFPLGTKCIFNCSDNNIEDLPAEIWRNDNTMVIPQLYGNRISTKYPKWVTEQKKWKEWKNFLNQQQKGYGYTIE